VETVSISPQASKGAGLGGAGFFAKIPEQSEDDFCENRFSGLTLLRRSEPGTTFACGTDGYGIYIVSLGFSVSIQKNILSEW